MGTFNPDGTWTSEVPGSRPMPIDPLSLTIVRVLDALEWRGVRSTAAMRPIEYAYEFLDEHSHQTTMSGQDLSQSLDLYLSRKGLTSCPTL